VIKNSSYVRVTGTGVTDKCGSKYLASQQQCGIVLSGVSRGISATTGLSHIEADHLEVKNTGAAGIKFHSQRNPIHVFVGAYVHHNYVHDIKAPNAPSEGLYIGTPSPDAHADVYNMEDVHVHHNLVERTNWDGINVKQAISNVSVHHNIMRNVGLLQVAGQANGIALGEVLNAKIYNNYIISSGLHGIKTGDGRSKNNTKYYNNVIINAGRSGIIIVDEELDPKIYNNTIIRSAQYGIQTAATGTARVFDNIVSGSTSTAITGAGTFSNNHTGSIASAGFVNPGVNDYHLTASSPAVDAGRNTGLFPAFDFDGKQRPIDSKTDLGAYEFGSNVPTPTNTPIHQYTTPHPTNTPIPTNTPTPLPTAVMG
jgi:hypothetical protein